MVVQAAMSKGRASADNFAGSLMLSLLAGRAGRLRGDGLPASRALLDLGVIALRIGAVIPISRRLAWQRTFLALDVYRWRSRDGYHGWVVVRGIVVRVVRVVRGIVVRPGVIPGVIPEGIDDDPDTQVSIPVMPVMATRSTRPHLSTRPDTRSTGPHLSARPYTRSTGPGMRTLSTVCHGHAAHARQEQP